jgi:hypothetical protein
MLGEITALQHEFRNDTVESTSLVSESFLAGAQSAEIVGCLWNDVIEELEFDSACWLCRVSEMSVDVQHKSGGSAVPPPIVISKKTSGLDMVG